MTLCEVLGSPFIAHRSTALEETSGTAKSVVIKWYVASLAQPAVVPEVDPTMLPSLT